MKLRQLAAIAAMMTVAAPGFAFDTAGEGASTMFYISIPLDGPMWKKQQWSAGLQLQGKREYQAVNIDSSMFNHFLPAGALEAKWIIAGVVAAGAAVAVGSKDKGTSATLQQQQEQNRQLQAAQQAGDCDPCKTTPK